MSRHLHAAIAVIASIAVCACGVAASAQVAADVDGLMRVVGERVAEYHRHLRNIICIERSTIQPVGSNLSPDGFSRTVESELRVELQGDGDATPSVIREIRRINGRAPRERDKKDRAGCADPFVLSSEPLAFLLPAHRDEYRFTSLRNGREDGRAALIVDFVSTTGTSGPQLLEDTRGHDDCFDWTGPLATKGRVWIDAFTHDVLRVDRHVHGPIDVRVPSRLQRRYSLPMWVVLEWYDETMSYKPVVFGNPDEVMMLPVSMESVVVVHNGLQSVRRMETFSNYRRFVAEGRIVKEP